jgi:hypothetical protein
LKQNDKKWAAESVFDEVWDCVIAAMHFSSEGIHLEIIDAEEQ